MSYSPGPNVWLYFFVKKDNLIPTLETLILELFHTKQSHAVHFENKDRCLWYRRANLFNLDIHCGWSSNVRHWLQILISLRRRSVSKMVMFNNKWIIHIPRCRNRAIVGGRSAINKFAFLAWYVQMLILPKSPVIIEFDIDVTHVCRYITHSLILHFHPIFCAKAMSC